MDGLFGTHMVMAAHRDGGHWSLLTTMELRVLNVFYSRADNITGEAYPGVQDVADDLRCDNRNRVRQAIRGLGKKGLLVVVSTAAGGGGRGHSTVRRLTVPAPVAPTEGQVRRRAAAEQTGTPVVPVSAPQTGTPVVPLYPVETGTPVVPVSKVETGTLSGVNGDTFDAQTGTPVVPRTTHITTHTTAQGVRGSADAEAEDLDSRIRRFVSRHPSLIPSPRIYADVGRLVEAVGWDRATDLIGEGAAAGKSFPVSWALAKAARQSREGSKPHGRPSARPEIKPGRHQLT